jgi:secondary thiamine-phosphate synthase enzyme
MISTSRITLHTQGQSEIHDITDRVKAKVAGSKIANGVVTLFVIGSTAAISTIEYEPGLLQDFGEAWERLVPKGIPYMHDRAWGESNGHSHVRATILGPSLTVPLEKGALTLGTWQQIVLVDFDIRPRTREVVVQVMGEV